MEGMNSPRPRATKIACKVCGVRLWWVGSTAGSRRWWSSEFAGTPGIYEECTPGVSVPTTCPDHRP